MDISCHLHVNIVTEKVPQQNGWVEVDTLWLSIIINEQQ